MKRQTGILFDLDGVVIDTEPIYDIFWKDAGIRYNVGIENFHNLIKGTTMPNILEKYFSNYNEEEKKRLVAECSLFESTMEIPEVPGSIDFLQSLKKAGYMLGLVTSSDAEKLKTVFDTFPIRELFDSIVTSERIKNGKPHPDCYLLGAKELGFNSKQCLVFEDSINGVNAANAANARVIGVTTTNPEEVLRPITFDTITNFKDVSIEQVKKWSDGI
ncbi:MAG: HAD family phosphatase [Bacteroidales bacterium]|nr:HAD family phosphatase [Bacteroidales bacterium]